MSRVAFRTIVRLSIKSYTDKRRGWTIFWTQRRWKEISIARFVTPMQVRVFPLISTRGCQLRTPYPRFHLIELIHSQSNQIAWMSNFTHDPFSSLRTFYRYVQVSNRLIHIFALIAPNYLGPSLDFPRNNRPRSIHASFHHFTNIYIYFNKFSPPKF